MTNKTIIRRQLDRELQDLFINLHPVLAKIYAARSVKSVQELERSLDQLYPFTELKGISQAVDVLAEAVTSKKRILIVADFDADGATSCAVAVRALHLMGCADVHYEVPNRFEYGYGLTPEIVTVAANKKPDVLVTVDNGISSVDGVKAARALGIQVVVTDHHLPGQQLPDATAIVNPNQPGDLFPSKNLAGVGVIFYVMLALRSRLRETHWFDSHGIEVPNLASLLDLVALGTVADVVPLDHNNRVLVEQGVRRIRAGQCCPGILALLTIGKRDHKRLVSTDLGFVVGPRLNAAGRLEDMSLGIECLLTNDPDKAYQLALQLDKLNKSRREIETDMRDQALADLKRLKLDPDKDELPYGYCLFDKRWHQGVIGILASRIKERLHRPVIAFALTGKDDNGEDEIKGSARSIPGLHIRDVLDAVAARHPDLISKFGGHAMAAGLSLQQKHYEAFKQAFDEEVRNHLSADDLREVVHTDGELDSHDLGMDLAELLREAGPWGQGFPEPVFEGEFNVVSRRVVGEIHLKMVVQPVNSKHHIDAIAFNVIEQDRQFKSNKLRMAYRLDVNEFRGNRTAQLIIEHMKEVD